MDLSGSWRERIPSMIDGLKPTQRKVLYCAFEKNLVDEINVAQLNGYVLEKSSYYEGPLSSIHTTIVGMAQNYVGSNNVNLLIPNGQFGTRYLGGKDGVKAKYARYMNTKLADVTRCIFPKEDDVLLDYLKENGLQIEPVWYLPIIPMVLVNGSEGIGTGWSTFIPNYNPRDIIANIRRLINNESMEPMDPWYKNFKGSIQRAVSRKKSGLTYTLTGTIDLVDGHVEGDDEDETDVKLLITELPIRKWTRDYQKFVETMQKDGFIKRFDNGCFNEAVEFTIVLSKKNYNLARQEGLVKKFKLTTSLTTSNMHLFDKDNKIVKYDSPQQILEEFYHLRLKYYIKRKERYLEIYQAELVRLDNQVRFILGVVEGEIIVCKRKKAELVAELRERGFTPIRRVKPVEPVVGAIEDEVAEGSEELGYSAETATEESLSDYDYLLFMAISSIYIEKVKELCANKDKVLNQIEDLKKQTEKSLWWKDLDELEKALDDKDKREAQQPAATKKGAPAREGQKPITDEMVDASPDKKVRKTRPLEVTKMRSSSLNSIQEEFVSAESVEQLNK